MVSMTCDTEGSMNHSCSQAWLGLNWESESNTHLAWAFMPRIWTKIGAAQVILWTNFQFLVKFGGCRIVLGSTVRGWGVVYFRNHELFYVEGNNGYKLIFVAWLSGPLFGPRWQNKSPIRGCHFIVGSI